MGHSVLDDLGAEVTGIAAPVSICMALTVALVKVLNPQGKSNSGAVFLASAYYQEQSGDSAGQKLSGSIINAIIFVSIVAGMTFILVLLFKYRCTKLIYAYMGFSGFSIFFLLTGIIVIQLLQKAGGHMDWPSFSIILFNFALVGSIVLFFAPAPLLLKQGYLVVTGVVVAFVFTWIPEWTTWVLLLAMATYDIVAVLIPGGPLKLLVELAQERDEDIPALVYQARVTRRQHEHLGGRPDGDGSRNENNEYNIEESTRMYGCSEDAHEDNQISVDEVGREASAALLTPRSALRGDGRQDESNHGVNPAGTMLRVGAAIHLTPDQAEIVAAHPAEVTVFALPEAIKLGLGDFIFYSVLVGRAAMYDMATVFACYIAIVAGLGCTLMWLAVAHKALPALPISITLAVIFYFVSRFVMEPVILPMTLYLVYF